MNSFPAAKLRLKSGKTAGKRKVFAAETPEGKGKKNSKPISHRSTTYPCYLPILGEFSRSWSYRFAAAKIR